MELRVCSVAIPDVLELRADKRIGGILAPLLYDFLDNFRRPFRNVTIISGGNLGSKRGDGGVFDGCMAHLIQNQSDIAFPLVKFPSDIPHVMQSSSLLSSKTVILSAYNNNNFTDGSEANVMDAFHSFSRGLWTLNIFTAAVFVCILVGLFNSRILCVRLTKRRKRISKSASLMQSLNILLANILKQHSSYSYCSRRASAKWILFLFALCSFLVIFYFSSMIKTEMVVQNEPETITSYTDILEKRTKPLWLMQLDDHAEFEQADLNTREGKIWILAHDVGIEKCFWKGVANILRGINPIATSEAVWLGPGYLGQAIIRNVCPYLRQNNLHDDRNLLVKSDSTAQEHLMGLLYSEYTHPKVAKKFNQLTQIELEKGFAVKHLRLLEFVVAPEKGGIPLRECMINKILYPDYEIRAMPLHFYQKLFSMHGYIILSGLLTLVLEISVFRMRRQLMLHLVPI
jgi:hypothetical protein